MNKKISVGVAAALILLSIAVTMTVSVIASMNLFDRKVLDVREREAMYDKLAEVDSAVRENYLYVIDEEQVLYALSTGYVNGLLDEDTVYLTAEEIAARETEQSGRIVTVGVETTRAQGGYLSVTKVYSSSSAADAGMIVGDIIIEIDGVNVSSIPYDEAVEMLHGIEGTTAEITYTRDSDERTVELSRSVQTSESVVYFSYEDYYYIHILAFNDSTVQQFDYAVNHADASGAVGLIVDLREVFGGYDISVAAGILDRLLGTGTTVLATYADGVSKVLYTSDSDGISVPIVVLVNAGTEGYSEMVAAVLSERNGCYIVGNTTAGRGTLQTLCRLTDGSGVYVTTALLKTPADQSFDGIGICPDYDVEMAPELVIATGEPDPDTDPQYKRALSLLDSVT